MKAKELFGKKDGALHHKLRSQQDLAHHIKNSVDNIPNYSLFLGAGCSATSGIQSGQSLIRTWMQELANEKGEYKDLLEHFSKEEASWFNPANPYASLFKKKYDLPKQRRRFVEREVDGASPSIGYAYLVDLASRGFFSTVFTTNFDDLIQEAFYQYSDKRPILCAHDSSVHSISVTSSRPKIIKLHGDYLFDDIKSTLRETESLEQNIKHKLIEFCKEFGLIILGYSGSDRSIIDVLEFLTKQENYLNNGLYWCFRADDEINNTLQNLLWRDRVYPVLIDGFDEFMAETHDIVTSSPLGIQANFNQSKIKRAIKLMLDDKYELKKNRTILAEINRIKNADQQTEISSLIAGLSSENEDNNQISMSDHRNLLEIKSLTHKSELKKAKDLAESEYYYSSNENSKAQYLLQLIEISQQTGDKGESRKWSDSLVDLDPNNVSYLLQKCEHLEEENLKYLKKLSTKKPDSYTIHNMHAAALLRFIAHTPPKNKELIEEVISIVNTSIKLEPSLGNEAWNLKYTALVKKSKSQEKRISDDIEPLIEKAENINRKHLTSFRLRQRKAADSRDSTGLQSVISELYEEHETSSRRRKILIDTLIADSLDDLSDQIDNSTYLPLLRRFYESHLTDKTIVNDPNLLHYKIRYHLEHSEDGKGKADSYFEILLKSRDWIEALPELAGTSAYISRKHIEKLKEKIEEDRFLLTEQTYYLTLSRINTELHNYDNALSYIDRAFDCGLRLSTYLTLHSYISLKLQKYDYIYAKHKKYKHLEKDPDFESWFINYSFSLVMDGKTIDEIYVRNLTAKSESEEVKLAAFALLGNEKDAERTLKRLNSKNKINSARLAAWPIIQWFEEKRKNNLAS